MNKVKILKKRKCLISPLQRSLYNNVKMTEVNMGRFPGSSEEVR
jgi:hypothetical protein